MVANKRFCKKLKRGNALYTCVLCVFTFTLFGFCVSNWSPFFRTYITYWIFFFLHDFFLFFFFLDLHLTGKMFSVGFKYLILHVLVVKSWSSENISNTKGALGNTVQLVARSSVHSLIGSIVSMLPSSSGTLWFLPKSKLPSSTSSVFLHIKIN